MFSVDLVIFLGKPLENGCYCHPTTKNMFFAGSWEEALQYLSEAAGQMKTTRGSEGFDGSNEHNT